MFDVIIVGYKSEARLTGVGKYTDSLIRILSEECGYSVGIMDLKGESKIKRFLYKTLVLPTKLIFSPCKTTYIIADESMLFLRMFLLGKRVGAIIHDRRGYSLFRSGYASLRDFFSYMQGAVLISSFDFIITVSAFTRNLLRHNRVIIMPNVFTLDINEDDVCRIMRYRADSINKTHSAYVLFVGSDEARKNFDMASKVALVLYERYGIKMLVIGMKTDSIYFKHFQCNPAFDFRFLVSNSQLNEIYQNALCLLNTSLFEGFGRVVIEAQLNCCPVISTLNSSLSEVLRDSALGIKETNSVPDVINLIESLFDQSAQESIVYKGLINAKRFTYDHVKQLCPLVKAIIDAK